MALLLASSPLAAQTAEADAAPLAPPLNWQILRGADKKPLARRATGAFEVELRAGAWCRVQQFDSSQFQSRIPREYFDYGFAAFALQPRLFDREGKRLDSKSIVEAIITLDNGEKGYGSWKGDENGGLYFRGLTPYAKKGTVKLEIADPKRPPQAEGRFEREAVFDNLPYPTQANTFIPLNRIYKSPRGSQIVSKRNSATAARFIAPEITRWIRVPVGAFAPTRLRLQAVNFVPRCFSVPMRLGVSLKNGT